MPDLLKKGFAPWARFFVFLMAASSSFLLSYLIFFQSGKIISLARLLIAGAVGVVLGGLAAPLFFKSIRNQKSTGLSLFKLFLMSAILCGFFYLMVPTLTNYLLAPRGQFDVTIHQSNATSNSNTQIVLLNSGLDYIPFRTLNYQPAIDNLTKGQPAILAFDSAGEAHFSWQGRAWKSIQIDLRSDQPVQLLLKSAGTTQNYAIPPGQVFTLNVPVHSAGYYSLLQGLVALATIILLWMFFVIAGLVKPEKINGFLHARLPWLPTGKWVDTLIGVVFGILVLFVISIGFQNRLYADDYCSISELRSAGYFTSVVAWFHQMTGRFSAHIFSFLFFEFPALNTIIGPLLAVICIGGSFIFLFTQLLGSCVQSLRLKLRALFSVTLLGTFFLSVPFLYESFIWNIHNVSVSGGLSFFNVACALLIRHLRDNKNNRNWLLWSLFFLILGVIGAGFNEVIGMLNLMLFGIILLVLLIKKPVMNLKNALTQVIAYLLGSGLGLILCVTAPGNSQRMTQLGFTTQVAHAFGVYVNLVRASTADIFAKNHYLPLFLILFSLTCAYYWGKSLPESFSWIKRSLTFFEKSLLVILPVAVFLISFAPSAFVAGYFPERTMAIPVTYAVSVAFLSALVLGNNHRAEGNQLLGIMLPVGIVVLGILAFNYLLSFSGQMRLFGLEWDAREQQIETAIASGDKAVTVTPYQYSPGTDLSTKTNLWLGVCEKQYYGIDLIVNDK
jgi:hypothetical protein